MIDFLKNFIENMFGMSLLDAFAFIYIFRNLLSFVLWLIKQIKTSVGV